MPATEKSKFDQWVILELMGHRRLAGRLTEEEIAGTAFLRLDIPDGGKAPAATQYYAAGAVYAITPTTEALARQVALRDRPAPVSRWELPQLEGKVEEPEDAEEEDDDGLGPCENCRKPGAHLDNEGVALCQECWDGLKNETAPASGPTVPAPAPAAAVPSLSGPTPTTAPAVTPPARVKVGDKVKVSRGVFEGLVGEVAEVGADFIRGTNDAPGGYLVKVSHAGGIYLFNDAMLEDPEKPF